MNNELKSKTIAGYQAWFRASEDLNEGWIHWSRGKAPGIGSPKFEVYPDIREYPANVLFPSGYPNFGDGRPALLFSSRMPETIDVHFSWAKQYGIDCLALQRFYSNIVPERVDSHYNRDYLKWVRESAERHGRLFYIMYDFSGAAQHGDGIVEGCSQDWIIQVEEAGLVESPNYACYGGKKIVCLWGFTGRDSWRYPAAKPALALIKWFQERGYYVIGGFPDNNWINITDEYAAVYKAVDMASPWTVGRFKPGGVENWWEKKYEEERSFCDVHGIAYMPVAFPGFAWCSFNGGPANAIPRHAGKFFWDQVCFLKSKNIEQLYLAMFDEYDEATVFMKAAEDSSQIPTGDCYFQTLSVDGYWLSSDYYLRLANAAGKVLRGEESLTEVPPVPHSIGPVYWRNGFEKRNYMNTTTNQPGIASVDVGLFEDEPLQGNINAEIVEKTVAGTSKYALYVTGTGIYKIASTKINCAKPLMLTYTSDTPALRAGVVLKDGSFVIKTSGEVFSAVEEICGIVVANEGVEGHIDDIELKESTGN